METSRHRSVLKAKLRRWDPDRVLNGAKLVRQLMAQPGWADIQLLVRQVRESHEFQLMEGKTHSQADYARLVGVIQGLRTLEDSCEALFEQARQIDEANRNAVERQAAAEGGG